MQKKAILKKNGKKSAAQKNQGKKSKKTDPGIFGMLQSVSRKDVADFLGIHYNSVSRWNVDLIRIDAINPDGTLNLLKILRWKCGKPEQTDIENIDPKSELEIKKLQKEIGFKESQIHKITSGKIERSFHEWKIESLDRTISVFIEKAWLMNANNFYGKSIEDLKKSASEYAKGLLDKLADAPEVGAEKERQNYENYLQRK